MPKVNYQSKLQLVIMDIEGKKKRLRNTRQRDSKVYLLSEGGAKDTLLLCSFKQTFMAAEVFTLPRVFGSGGRQAGGGVPWGFPP